MYKFKAKIEQSNIGKGGAYVIFPYDIKKEFGQGRVKVRATFDNEEYFGSIVNMGLKDKLGNICYIIGVTKAIREKISKNIGDEIEVTIEKI